MTQPPPQETPPPLSPNGSGEPVVNPTPESRLDQLTAEYALQKPKADAATERLKELTDSIKAELATLLPDGATSILLTSPHLLKPLRLEAVESWRFDAKTCKTEDPHAYVRFAKKSTTWRLAAVR